jgi:hypothetical protein
VTLLQPLAPNLDALSNLCPAAQYSTDSCPAQSQVGTATAITPLLPTPLSGPVRLVENPGAFPRVVVYLNGLINVRLIGDISLSAAGVTTTFAGIPDVPLSSFRLSFNGGSGGLLNTTEDLCTTAASIKGELASHSGKTIDVTTAPAVQGCAASQARPKWPTATLSLSKVATSAPTLRFAAKRGVGAKRLSTVAITLPGSLSFDKGSLSRGVRASKSLSVSLSGKHTMVLQSKAPAGVTSITALVGKGALRASKSLRSRVAKHPKVTVAVRFTERAGGRVLTRRKTVTVR